jgi:flagellar biogenesis protein FliO
VEGITTISDFTGRGNLKKLIVRAAGVIMALAIAVPPLAGQANSSGGSAAAGTGTTAPGTTASGLVAPVDESKTPLGGPGTPAGTAAAGAASAAQGANVSTWDFVRMLLVLAAVVVVIYLVFWLLRRGSRARVPENDLIRVLGSRGLSGNRAMHLVEVGSSLYLVGSADGGVRLIAEITDKESADAVRLKAAETAPGGKRTFTQILTEIFRPTRSAISVGEGIGLLKEQRDRLKKL